MNRSLSAAAVGEGGVVATLLPESVYFPDEAQPTLVYTTASYITYGLPQTQCNIVWDTTWTQGTIRSSAKDQIKQHILDTYFVDIPKASIKMLNNPE